MGFFGFLGVAFGPRFPLYLLLSCRQQKDAAAIANALVNYNQLFPFPSSLFSQKP